MDSNAYTSAQIRICKYVCMRGSKKKLHGIFLRDNFLWQRDFRPIFLPISFC